MLAASEALGVVFSLRRMLKRLHEVGLPVVVLIDRDGLCHSLSSQRSATDKSLPAYVKYIRYILSTDVGGFEWILGCVSLADPGKRTNCFLIDNLASTVTSAEQHLDV